MLYSRERCNTLSTTATLCQHNGSLSTSLLSCLQVFRLRQANEQRGGTIQIHGRKSAFLLRAPSCASSVVSTASNATSSATSTATLTGSEESSPVTGINSNSSDTASSRSTADGRRRDNRHIVATSERRKGQQTIKNRGRTSTLSSNSVDDGEEHSGEVTESRPSSTSVHSTVGDAHSGDECHVGASEARTRKADRGIAVNIRGGHDFSPPNSASLQQRGPAKKVPVREMTSLQLLQGHGWASRVSEVQSFGRRLLLTVKRAGILFLAGHSSDVHKPFTYICPQRHNRYLIVVHAGQLSVAFSSSCQRRLARTN